MENTWWSRGSSEEVMTRLASGYTDGGLRKLSMGREGTDEVYEGVEPKRWRWGRGLATKARLMEKMRVIDNEICYRAKENRNVYDLFQTRANLFRMVYTHAKVKALEYMLVDAFLLANDYLRISDNVLDSQSFWKLDDTILKVIETSNDRELAAAREIVIRMRRRELYQCCNEYAVPKEKLEHFKTVRAEDIVCSQVKSGVNLSSDDIVVSNVKIYLTRGKEDPVQRVHFFKDYESDEKFNIPKERISHLLPDCFEDRIVRVYSKKPGLVDAVSEAFENFQLRTYGIKTQVHGTPKVNKGHQQKDDLS
ncbi:hypothetical protein L7F22_052387 [Adiantum nelumboides]|nr:hypothetical protein [Adiantum nelumboides]